MILTNRQNLPEPIVRAVSNDDYDNGGADYSVTTLIKPPQIVALERKHANEITEDVSDRIWALMGQLGHSILERAADSGIVEHRFFIRRQGKKVGGRLDLWRNADLLDYKFTSAWAVKDGLKPEWEQQININALLCRENGIEVQSGQIVAVLRDWSKLEAKRNQDYPKSQVIVIPVPMWTPEQCEQFVQDRLKLHIAAADGNCVPCSDEERWAKPAVFAVMKAGRKTAVKLHEDHASAENHAISVGGYVETRPAVQTRCEFYCAAAKWCPQYRTLSAVTPSTKTILAKENVTNE